MRFIKKIFGYCYGCGRWFKYPKRRRMNTMFEKEESNYEYTCLECHEEHEEYWQERWDEINCQRW